MRKNLCFILFYWFCGLGRPHHVFFFAFDLVHSSCLSMEESVYVILSCKLLIMSLITFRLRPGLYDALLVYYSFNEKLTKTMINTDGYAK